MTHGEPKDFVTERNEVTSQIVSPKVKENTLVWDSNNSLFYLVAEMILRCHWDPSNFMFLVDYGISDKALMFIVKGHEGVSLSGYNFAAQVRQICRAIEDAGLLK